jgi:geranylgeranyl pyrophosphate synthase
VATKSIVNISSPSRLAPIQSELDELVGEVESFMKQQLLTEVNLESAAAVAAVYHLESGGRRIRARLALQASLALELNRSDAIILAATVEFLHNASLIHDDLQDDEVMRHGMPTVGAAFGTNIAICVGDLFLSATYGTLGAYSNSSRLPQLIASVHAATSAAIRGQCAGFPHDEGDSPNNLNFYRQVAIEKSGALLSLPLKLAFLAAGCEQYVQQADEAAKEFAVGYQIMDDLQDFEKDGPMAMNVVVVLQANWHIETAMELARQMGLDHLQNAADLAEKLPNGVGYLLRNLAISLRQDPPTT